MVFKTTCGRIITSFINRYVKRCFNGISQAFHLFPMTHSNEMALFSILFLKYIDIYLVFCNYPTFGNTQVALYKEIFRQNLEFARHQICEHYWK